MMTLLENRLGVCGCPEEVYSIGRNDCRLLVHFEIDGTFDAFLEFRPDRAEADDWKSFPPCSPAEARRQAFAWAEEHFS